MLGDVSPRFHRPLDDPLDLGRPPVRLRENRTLGEQQVNLNPMRIAQVAVPPLMVAQAALLRLPIEDFGEFGVGHWAN